MTLRAEDARIALLRKCERQHRFEAYVADALFYFREEKNLKKITQFFEPFLASELGLSVFAPPISIKKAKF